MKSLFLLFILGVLASAVGCSGLADIPATPDLTALRADYAAPSAMLDPQGVIDALPESSRLEALIAGFRSTNYVLTGIDQVSSTNGQRASGRIRLQGAIHATLRCPGAGEEPVFDAATNGTVSLTIALAESSIRRDIGGEAKNCLLKGRLSDFSIPVVINGPVALDLGRDLSLGSGWSGKLLVSLTGELKVGDLFTFHDLSAQFDDGHFEHLIRLPSGATVVIDLSADAIRVHGRNGTWICTFSRSCLPE